MVCADFHRPGYSLGLGGVSKVPRTREVTWGVVEALENHRAQAPSIESSHHSARPYGSVDGALPDLSDFARETGTVDVYRKFANFGNVRNKFKTFKNRKSNKRTHTHKTRTVFILHVAQMESALGR